MSKRMELFENEVRRSFDVYGSDIGLEMNAALINTWEKSRFINEDEYHHLRDLSRACYSDLPLEHLGKLWESVIEDGKEANK